MNVAIKDYGVIAGTVAATSAIEATLHASNGATQAVGNAILPPGTEGASTLAKIKQTTNTADFGTKLGLGLVELNKRSALMGAHAAEGMSIDLASAGAVSAVDTAI